MTDYRDTNVLSGKVDVLLITAVADERNAVLELETDWVPGRDSHGYTIHSRTDTSGLTWVLARALDMGTDPAATVATSLVNELKPSCLAMVGVCAGDGKNVELGDVIVAERTFRSDTGKLKAYYKDGKLHEDSSSDIRTFQLAPLWRERAEDFPTDWSNDVRIFERPRGFDMQEYWLLQALYAEKYHKAPRPVHLPERKVECPDWESVIKRLAERGQVSFSKGLELLEAGEHAFRSLSDMYPDGLPAERTHAITHVAPIATGAMVVQDEQLFPRIQKMVRKTLGFEMESAAIANVAWTQNVNHWIIAKGVQDFADVVKSDRFRKYAVETSYRFLSAFIRANLDTRRPPEKHGPHGESSEPSLTYTADLHPVPIVRGFVGRESELQKLATELEEHNGVYVFGMRGIGKTSLILTFSKRWKEMGNSSNNELFYFNCDTHETRSVLTTSRLLTSFSAFFQSIGSIEAASILSNKNLSAIDRLNVLVNVLAQGRFLVFFDNLQELLNDGGHLEDDNLGSFLDCLLTSDIGQSRIIFASYRRWAFANHSVVKPLRIPILNRKDSRLLLMTLVGINDPAVADRAARLVGRHPKALQWFSVLPDELGLTVEQLINVLMAIKRPEEEEKAWRDRIREELLLRVYKRLDRKSAQLLCRLSVFRRPVQYSALCHMLSSSDFETRTPRKQLLNSFLIESADIESGHYLHTLVREFGLEHLENDAEEAKTAHRLAADWWANQVDSHSSWERTMQFEIEQCYHLNKAGEISTELSLINRTVTALMHKKTEAYKSGRYREAVEYCRDWLNYAPYDAQAHWHMACSMIRVDEKVKDILTIESHLNHAIELGLNTSAIRNEYGRFLAGLGRNQEAEKQFKIGIKVGPNDIKIRTEYGGFLARLGRNQEAEEQFKIGIKIAQNNAPIRNEYGRFLARLGRNQEAEEQFKIGIKADPNHAPIRGGYGRFLSGLGRNQEAEEQFKSGLKADPNDVALYHEYATFLKSAGRHDEANQYYQSVILLPNNSYPLRKKAKSKARRSKRTAEKIREYEAALEQDSNVFEANYKLGLELTRSIKDPARALSYLERAILLEPNNDAAILAYGICLSQLERWEDALFQLRGISGVVTSEVSNACGNCFLGLNRWQEAEEAYRKAIQLAVPAGQTKYLHNLARLFAHWPDTSRLKEAEDLCNQIIRIYPNYYWLSKTQDMIAQRKKHS